MRNEIDKNYKIEISLLKDEQFCLCPYFWCLLYLSSSGDWCDCGHGWAKTPEEAWNEALEWYDICKAEERVK